MKRTYNPLAKMTSPKPTGQTGQTGARRKLLLSALTLVLCVGLVECASCGMYRVVRKQAFSYEDVAQQRSEQANADVVEGAVTRGARSETTEVLHPYLGYVKANDGVCDKPQKVPVRNQRRYLVLIAGGSVANNLYHEGGAEVLTRRLTASGLFGDREVIVLNGALYGYHQPQQLLCLTYLASHGRNVDMVINLDGVNEIIGDAVSGAVKAGVYPTFPLEWPSRLGDTTDRGKLVLLARVVSLREERKSLAQTFSRFPLRASVTASFVWAALDRMVAARTAEAIEASQAYKPPARRAYRVTGPSRAFLADEDKRLRWLAGYWYQSSLQMEYFARINRTKYFHFLQPNQYVADTKPFSEAERTHALALGGPHHQAVRDSYQLLIDRGKQLDARGVAYFDLTQIYAGVKETLYIDACCHVNRRGSELMAEAIADRILENLSRKKP